MLLNASALLIFDNLVVMHFCAHDVAVACCLAMAEVWVQLPLGALFRLQASGVRLQGTKQSVKYTPCLIGNCSGFIAGLWIEIPKAFGQ